MSSASENKHVEKFGHWEILADTRELYWSDEVYRIHGLEAGNEVDVEAAINAYHPDDRDMVTEYVRRALEEKEDYQFELRLVRTDGEIRYVKSTGVVRLKPDGEVRSVFGVFQDITELKRTEEVKKKNEALIKALFEHSPTPVSIKDLDGKFLLISPAYTRYLGITPEEAIGQSIDDIFPSETATLLDERDKTVISSGTSFEFDESFPVKIGSSTLQISKFPIKDDDGTVTSIGSVGIDITETVEAQKEIQRHRESLEKIVEERTTELRLSEEKYRAIFETSRVGMAMCKMDGTITECNQAFNDIVGYGMDEISQLTYWDLTPREYEEAEAQQLQSLEKIGKYGPYEKQYIHKNGKRVPVLLNGTLVKSANGDNYIWSIVQDISKRVQTEEALLVALKAAEEANRTKSEFLANMSHELRTPLNAIIGFSEVMKRETFGSINDKYTEYANDINKSGLHLLVLINQILDLSKIESGNIDLCIESIELKECFEDCMTIIRPEAEKQKIAVIGKCGTMPVVRADPVRLRQVMINILSNAVKYNKFGGTIEVWCEENYQTGIGCLYIKDTGLGVSEEYRKIIFDPFSRDPNTAKQLEGTGIGLSIAKSLMNSMNGDIGFESTVGEGTTFWINIPLADDSATT